MPRANISAARLVFELQQTLFNRSTRLFEGKVLSENDYLRARTTFEDARVKIETARQKLFALSLTAEQIEALPQQPVETLRRQELRAPISGRIAERRVELGSLVGREGQESELFVIADLSVVWADLVGIAFGSVRHSRGPENHARQAAARVRRPPSCSSARCSTRRRARPASSPRLTMPRANGGRDLFVTAEIPTDEAPAAIVVAKTALQTVKGDTVVFVRTEKGFEARKVGVGRQDARLVEITAGLAAGERIATANTFVLKAELGKAEAEHDD